MMGNMMGELCGGGWLAGGLAVLVLAVLALAAAALVKYLVTR